MIIKGGARGEAGKLAIHLQRTDTNEKVTLIETRGVAAQDVDGALAEMEAVASGARTTRPFYHASINARADEVLTDEQRMIAVDQLEEALGLTGQPRIVVDHVKEGKNGIERQHTHVVWSRIDLEDMTAISDSHNFREHEKVSRALSLEFGHELVQGAHVAREGIERPLRTPSQAEMMQAERSGITPQEVTQEITGLWTRTDSGQAFAAALTDAGYILARGDRRGFVVIDAEGETHSLGRRIEGVRAAELRERLADVDPANLPSVDQARDLWEEGVSQRHMLWEESACEPIPLQASEPIQGPPPEGSQHQAVSDLPEQLQPAPDDIIDPTSGQPFENPEATQPAPHVISDPASGDQPFEILQASEFENLQQGVTVDGDAEHQQSVSPETALAGEQAEGSEESTETPAVDLAPLKDGIDLAAGAALAAVGFLANAFDGFLGGGKPPPTPEQQQKTAQREDNAAERARERRLAAFDRMIERQNREQQEQQAQAARERQAWNFGHGLRLDRE